MFLLEGVGGWSCKVQDKECACSDLNPHWPHVEADWSCTFFTDFNVVGRLMKAGFSFFLCAEHRAHITLVIFWGRRQAHPMFIILRFSFLSRSLLVSRPSQPHFLILFLLPPTCSDSHPQPCSTCSVKFKVFLIQNSDRGMNKTLFTPNSVTNSAKNK